MATTLKVAALIVKALVKPLAGVMKKNAVEPGRLRETFHWTGQMSNTIMTHVQLRSLGHKVKKIKPLPEDDAVKSGADICAEALVLTVGMLTIAAELTRKKLQILQAAEKARLQTIEEKKRKDLKILEKERDLQTKLLSLEERMMDVENAKFHKLHDKLLYEQTKHLIVTENLLKRIHYLEEKLNITTPYPLLPADLEKVDKPTTCSVHSYNTDIDGDGISCESSQSPTTAQHTNELLAAAQEVLTHYDEYHHKGAKIADKTNSFFHYSTKPEQTATSTSTTTTSKSSISIKPTQTHSNYEAHQTPQHLNNVILELESKLAHIDATTKEDLAKLQHHLEEDILHHLFDKKLPNEIIHVEPPSAQIFAKEHTKNLADSRAELHELMLANPLTPPETKQIVEPEKPKFTPKLADELPKASPTPGKEHLFVAIEPDQK
eukprot:UN01231